MSIKKGTPYVQYWPCPSCPTQFARQIRSDYCIHCGTPRPRAAQWSDPSTPAEWALARAAAADSNVFADAANSVFCGHCTRRISATSRFCPGCGNPVDASDQPALAKRGGVSVAVSSISAYLGRRTEDHPAHTLPTVSTKPKAVTVAKRSDPTPLRTSVPRPAASPVRSAVSHATRSIPMPSFIRTLWASPKVRRTLGIGLGIFLCIALVWGIIWINQTHEETVTIAQNGFEYNGWFEVGYIDVETGTCWEGDCPKGFVEVSSTNSDYYPEGLVKIGEESESYTDTQQSCEEDVEVNCTETVDGVVQPAVCVTPGACTRVEVEVTKIVDVNATKTPYSRKEISYTLDVYKTRNETTGWVASHTPQLPSYTLNPNKREEFTGASGFDYRIKFDMSDGSFQYYDTSDANFWFSLVVGQTFTANVTRSGSIQSLVLP